LGYGTKADIFSAGIILCIILTGVSPFHGEGYQEVLLKNRTGNVALTGKHWSFVSEEAKDLVAKMVAKDPQNRCTAKEALQHEWFSLECIEQISLYSAQENMKRHQNEDRFNVRKIMAKLSVITCTPLLNSRFASKDSPLIVPKDTHKLHAQKIGNRLPNVLVKRREAEEKKEKNKGITIRDINDKFRKDRLLHKEKKQKDYSGDFDEYDMDEKSAEVKEKIIAKIPSPLQGFSLLHNTPMTPSILAKKDYMDKKIMNTPLQNRRELMLEKKTPYLKEIAKARLKEDTKADCNFIKKLQEKNINPFTSDYPAKEVEDAKQEQTEVTEAEILNFEVERFNDTTIKGVQKADIVNKGDTLA